MLKIFRKYTKVIIWFVVGSFILWGGYSISSLKKEGRFAGEVFGQPVTFQEYNQFYRATQLFMPSEQPVNDPDLLRDYTWQNIIYAREAKRKNIKVTDGDVRNEIANILQQQGLASPTAEQYRIWLTRTLHLSPREFEEGLREFMRIQKLLRTEIAGFTPAGTDKLTDPKAKEAALAQQKNSFMAWTSEVNQRAALKDYLALSQAREEEPDAAEKTVIETPVSPKPTGSVTPVTADPAAHVSSTGTKTVAAKQ